MGKRWQQIRAYFFPFSKQAASISTGRYGLAIIPVPFGIQNTRSTKLMRPGNLARISSRLFARKIRPEFPPAYSRGKSGQNFLPLMRAENLTGPDLIGNSQSNQRTRKMRISLKIEVAKFSGLTFAQKGLSG